MAEMRTRVETYRDTTSLWVLSDRNWFRRGIQHATFHPMFDRIMALAILINCVIIAAQASQGGSPALTMYSNVFTAVFAVEMIMKVIATGFRDYWADPWLRVDGLVVVLSSLSLIQSFSGLTSVRLLRLLRALRMVGVVPGLRRMMQSFLAAARNLISIIILILIYIFICAIIGMQLFMGKFRQHCFYADTNQLVSPNVFCSMDPSAGGAACPAGHGGGAVSFDNMAKSSLTVLYIMTGEGWSNIMFYADDTVSVYCRIYFVLVMFLGYYCFLPLATSVLSQRFQNEKQAYEAANRQVERRNSSTVPKATPRPLPTLRRALTRKESLLRLQKSLTTRAIGQIRRLGRSRVFNVTIIVCIVINGILLSMIHWGQSPAEQAVQNYGNLILTYVFLFELVVKVVEIGPKAFFFNALNLFDTIIVVSSWIDTLAETGVPALIALRSFRLLRLMRYWPSLRAVVTTMLASVQDVVYLLVFGAIYEFIFAVIGMQMFRTNYHYEDGSVPRANFNDLAHAATTVFQVHTSSNWNEVTYNIIGSGGWWVSPFPLSMFVVGHFILFQLFVAIMLTNFDSTQMKIQPFRARVRFRQRVNGFRTRLKRALETTTKTAPEPTAGVMPPTDNGHPTDKPEHAHDSPRHSGKAAWQSSSSSSMLGSTKSMATLDVPGATGEQQRPPANLDTISFSFASRVPKLLLQKPSQASSLANLETGTPVRTPRTATMLFTKTSTGRKSKPVHQLHGRSLMIFSPTNRLRLVCHQVVSSRGFAIAVLIVIFVNCVLLTVQTTPEAEPFINGFDNASTAFFTVELVLQVVVNGLLFGPGTYLKDPWNVFDLCLLASSYIGLLFASSAESQFLIALSRALRAMRPLRMVKRFENMRLVIKSLWTAMPSLLNAVAVIALLFWMFAVIGVQFFQGRLARCEDFRTGDVLLVDQATCQGVLPGNITAIWRNPDVGHLDDVGSALLLLFEISSWEGWPTAMNHLVDATPTGQPPIQDYNYSAVLYIIIFLVVVAEFAISIFMAVVVDEYKHNIVAHTNGAITDAQKRWLEFYRDVINNRPQDRIQPPVSPTKLYWTRWDQWRMLCYRLVKNKYFDKTITLVIIMNMAIMSCEYYGDGIQFAEQIDLINTVLSFAYLVEMVIKWSAFGFSKYFASTWHRFDCTIVITAAVQFLVQSATVRVWALNPGTLRVTRVFRVLRLFRHVPGLSQVLRTLLFSLPALYNVGILTFLFFFIYAAIGAAFFSNIPNGNAISDYANFRSFQSAFCLLAASSTGEGWNVIMHDLSVQPPYCDPSLNQCGIPWLARLYMISFKVIANLVVLNLFIAILKKNFEDECEKDEDDGLPIRSEHIAAFAQAWSEFSASDMMYVTQLGAFLQTVKIDGPLGAEAAKIKDRAALLRFLRIRDVPAFKTSVHYVDITLALTETTFIKHFQVDHIADIPEENQLFQCIRSELFRAYPARASAKNMHPAHVVLGAIMIQTQSRILLNRLAAIRQRAQDNLKEHHAGQGAAARIKAAAQNRMHTISKVVKSAFSSDSPRGSQ
ncbi:hypothetical protein PBRA_001399, partial [Plasmodiophora brassicae]